MGATPSHENDIDADPESSDDDDILKMQNSRFRVSFIIFNFFLLSFLCTTIMCVSKFPSLFPFLMHHKEFKISFFNLICYYYTCIAHSNCLSC